MRGWKLVLLFAALAVVAAPAVVGAAVNNTLHDIDAYVRTGGYAGTPPPATGGTCSYCHVPHKAVGARLWPSSPVTTITGSWLGNANKTTPRLCYSCHGTGTGYTDALNDRVFSNSAHLDNHSTLQAWGEAAMAGVTLDTGGDLECSSCHDVHNADRRPFIKGVTTDGDITANCVLCHAARNNQNLGAANTVAHVGGSSSQHPVKLAVTAPHSFQGTWDSFFNGSAVTGAGAANAAAWAVTGGKKEATGGLLGCQTCHIVHGYDNGTIPNVLLAKDTYGANGTNFCTGCHTGPAPTSTAGGTHPVGTNQAAWGLGGLSKPASWPWGGTDNTLVCESCHDVHYGAPTTSLVRRNGSPQDETAAAYASAGDFCISCHAASYNKIGDTMASVPNHHPVGIALTSGTNIRAWESAGSIYVTDNTRIDYSVNPPTRSTSGATATYTWGNDGTNTLMTCGNCHFGAGAKAHAPIAVTSPLAKTSDSAFCVDCHDFNPSPYVASKRTVQGATHNASHFVGPIVSTTYKRTTAFTNGFVPQYSADGTNGGMMCLSCHYWKNDNKASNNAGTTPAPSGTTLVAASVKGLVAAAGNANDNTDGTEYMCTGCHGASPGGNTSHPTLPTAHTVSGDVTAYVATAANPAGSGGQATITPGTKVNCESCHRPHNASVGTGALILEADNLVTPTSAKAIFELASGAGRLNQEGVCKRCHNR